MMKRFLATAALIAIAGCSTTGGGNPATIDRSTIAAEAAAPDGAIPRDHKAGPDGFAAHATPSRQR
ncbi:MAG: hypothetical protein AAGJ87_00990, partial [Pseudomonadota bacterium]